MCLERANIAEWQGTSEDQKDAAKPTQLNMNLFIAIGITASLGLFATTEACTGMQLKAKDGSLVNGRTLEFGRVIDVSIAVVPRNYDFHQDGLKYTSKYAAVGAATFGETALLDGLNEKGLAVGTFYFPGYASYAAITPENQPKTLSASSFPNWILTQFATVDEVKAALENVAIANTPIKGWGNTAPPFHYIVYDKSGSSIVIEPVDKKLVVHDNPIGIFTNSPTFDWHLTNLRNYINLTPNNAAPKEIDGITLASFGQGSGLMGLPGDFSPPSRFVRATLFAATAIPPSNAQEGVLQLFHLLNQFDIPIGAAREVKGDVIYSDYTQLTAVRDPQALKYFFRTYDDQSIHEVDLTSFDLDAKSIKQNSSASKQPIVNISKELK